MICATLNRRLGRSIEPVVLKNDSSRQWIPPSLPNLELRPLRPEWFGGTQSLTTLRYIKAATADSKGLKVL
jgi:hypothetical protein